MLVSWFYLRKKLGDFLTLEILIDALNNLGYEVEKVKNFSDINKLEYGFLEDVFKNSNSKILHVCKVKTSQEKILTIQTAANNVRKGQYVAFFPITSKVNGIFIETKEIRGIVSEGMLASAKELGFNPKLLPKSFHNEILIFEKKNLNLSPMQDLGINDCIIDIEIKNRKDANSYFVLLAELSSYFADRANKFYLPHKSIILKNSEEFNQEIMVFEFNYKNLEITTEDLLFVAKHNLDATAPDSFLSSLILIKFGIWTKVVNLREENGKRFSFKNILVNEEEINSIVFDKDPVLYSGCDIRDNYRPNSDSLIVSLIVPTFCPKKIKENLKKLRLVSPVNSQVLNQQKVVLSDQFLNFLKNKIDCNFTKKQNLNNIENENINIDIAAFEELIGMKGIWNSKQGEIVKKKMIQLGFEFKKNQVFLPNYRFDILNQQDLAGEFMKFFGYSNLVLSSPKNVPFFVSKQDNLKEKLISLGYQEVVSFTLTNSQRNIFNPFNFQKKLFLKTYFSSERMEVRNSILNTILEIVEFNLKNKFSKFQFFDVGMICEGVYTLLILRSGLDFASLRRDLINLFPKRELFFKRVESGNKYLLSNLSSYLYEDEKLVGWIGRIHPSLYLPDIMAAEIKIVREEMRELPSKEIIFKNYNKKSLKKRSLTFELDINKDLQETLENLKKIPGIFSFEIDSIFNKENIKKVTFSILLEDGFEREFDEKYY